LFKAFELCETTGFFISFATFLAGLFAVVGFLAGLLAFFFGDLIFPSFEFFF